MLPPLDDREVFVVRPAKIDTLPVSAVDCPTESTMLPAYAGLPKLYGPVENVKVPEFLLEAEPVRILNEPVFMLIPCCAVCMTTWPELCSWLIPDSITKGPEVP